MRVGSSVAWPKGLGVESQQVIPAEARSEHRRQACQAGVGSMSVVAVQPARQGCDALMEFAIGAGVGPFA
jgi:hypothetical protein